MSSSIAVSDADGELVVDVGRVERSGRTVDEDGALGLVGDLPLQHDLPGGERGRHGRGAVVGLGGYDHGHQDTVDDMHHAIAGLDVGLGDRGAADRDHVVSDPHAQRRPVEHLDRAGLELARQVRPGHDV